MGIPGLCTFMKEKFTRWKKSDFGSWDHVIIDGNNLCSSLYTYSWRLGGEYDKFSSKVEEFFTTSGIRNPIVVFDHGKREDITADESARKMRKKRWKTIEELDRVLAPNGWDPYYPSKVGPRPLLRASTFLSVLQNLKIEVKYANGSADRAVAALAEQYKCPALSSDSDFFLFNLTYGFIHYKRHFIDKIPESLYCLSEFQQQFELSSHELCLIIPAAFRDETQVSIGQYSTLISEIKHCEVPLQYCTSDNAKASPTDFEDVKKFYLNLESSLFEDPNMSQFPEWALDSFRRGRFPSISLLVAYRARRNILLAVVEDVRLKSAWLISQEIRQYIYGLLGVSSELKVMETMREDHLIELTDKMVSPSTLKFRGQSRSPTIFDDLFQEKITDQLRDVVLSVLKCHSISRKKIKELFLPLPEKWKLPIAATFYWHQKLDIASDKKRELLKSLLLSFLTCSGHGKLKEIQIPHLTVTPATRDSHLLALHAFSQWQCVYLDALNLNYLAREPFAPTSPAELYSGEVAMHYALTDKKNAKWMDDVVGRDSEEWEFLNKFLHLVTGKDEWSVVPSSSKH